MDHQIIATWAQAGRDPARSRPPGPAPDVGRSCLFPVSCLLHQAQARGAPKSSLLSLWSRKLRFLRSLARRRGRAQGRLWASPWGTGKRGGANEESQGHLGAVSSKRRSQALPTHSSESFRTFYEKAHVGGTWAGASLHTHMRQLLGTAPYMVD